MCFKEILAMKWNGKVWEGVYKDFNEAPNDTGFFDKEKWLEQEKSECIKKNKLLKYKNKSDISQLAKSNDYCLPVVLSMLDRGVKEEITILDFGGGLASIYHETMEMLECSENIKFLIVENSNICQLGNHIYESNNKIEFATELPNNLKVDIVHAGSSMQYVDDWTGLLDIFSQYKPKYMIFSDLPAGNIETFVTVQNHDGELIPVRFWNLQEFVDGVESLGYRLVFKSRFINGYIDYMGCFERKYRLEYFSQLIFARKE